MAIKKLDLEKCIFCDKCYETCPMDVFRKVGKVVYIAYPDDCMTCFLCEMDCSVDAIYVDPYRSREPIGTW